jgi:hypothetical protein
MKLFLTILLLSISLRGYCPEADNIPFKPVSFEIMDVDNGFKAVITANGIYLYKELPRGILVSERKVRGKYEIKLRYFESMFIK